MKKKTGLKGVAIFSSFLILLILTMFELIKKTLLGLLTSLVKGSNHTKYVLLSNQKRMTQPTFINIQPKEYSQEFHYYPFAIKLDRCVGVIIF